MIEWVAYDDLMQFGSRISMTIQSIEEIEKLLQILIGITRWTRAKALQETLSFCWGRRLPPSCSSSDCHFRPNSVSFVVAHIILLE